MHLHSLIAALTLASALPDAAGTPANVLVVVLDDIGRDYLGCYGQGAELGLTPELDAVAAQGLRFTRFIGGTACTVTRAMLLTGLYPSRTGMTTNARPPGQLGGYGALEWEPPASTVFVASELRAAGVATGAFGKWQIHHPLSAVQYDFVRDRGGFGRYVGWPWPADDNATGANETETWQGYLHAPAAGAQGWPRIADNVIDPAGAPAPGSLVNLPGGALDWCGNYLPTQLVDDAIAWISAAQEPWFCYVAPQTPHTPLQAPPPALYAQDLAEITYPAGHPLAGSPVVAGTSFTALARQFPGTTEVLPYWRAAVRATSRELGRLFAALPANTTIVILADNGTVSVAGADGDIVQPPFDPQKAKGTLYEEGTRLPLIVAGPGVVGAGGASGALVHACDLFETLLALAGAASHGTAIDSISFLPVLDGTATSSGRAHAITVFHRPLADPETYPTHVFNRRWYACQNALGYKLHVRVVDDPGEELYRVSDLAGNDVDPHEHLDLLAAGHVMTVEERQNYKLLQREIDAYIRTIEHLPGLAF